MNEKQNFELSQDKRFYEWFKLLLVVLIILNMVDTVTTTIGVYHLDDLAEGNWFLQPFLNNIHTFILVKVVVISGLFLVALAYLYKVHHAFIKLWENEVALVCSSLIVLFYLAVVVNNVVLIFISTASL